MRSNTLVFRSRPERAESTGAAGRAPRPLLRFALEALLLVGLPLIVAVSFVRLQASLDVLGFDFLGTLWEPGKDILAGRSPYPAPVAAAVGDGNPAVYPPPLMLLVAPLTVLPWSVGLTLWSVLLVSGAALGLSLLGVRDWRVYGVVVATEPVLFGLTYGNVTLLLILGLAVAWRYRERAWLCGAAVAALVVMKLFLWPLVVWLVLTRRFRAAAVSVAASAVVTVAAWAVIGFDGLGDYPRLLRTLTDVYAAHTQSLYALVLAGGAGTAGATGVSAAVACALLGAAVWLVRQRDGDRRAFTAALFASLAFSPIAWIYYFALLVVPLALYRPRFSAAWLLLLGFWVVPFLPGSGAPPKVCCAPPGVPDIVYRSLHTDPKVVTIAGDLFVAAIIGALTIAFARRGREGEGRC